MGALFARIKVWIAETLNFADLNAEIQNILDKFDPIWMDDYSTNVAEMLLQTDPGDFGSESLPTTLAGEIERLRFVLAAIVNGTNAVWIDDPDISLSEINTLFNQTAGLSNNRIVSGRVDSNGQPAFLVAAGSAASVDLKATSTSFVYRIKGTQYTITSDVTLSGLVAAPSSNNTALVNDATLTDQTYSRMMGEWGREIIIDTVGSEITNKVGKVHGFKINDGSTDEFFISEVESLLLKNARRGYFFNSSETAVKRLKIADDDTITVMSTAWIYAKTDLTIEPVYTSPTYGNTADRDALSPAASDRHFNQQTSKWETFGGVSWADSDATLIGLVLVDTSNAVAARSFPFFDFFKSTNTASLQLNSVTTVKTAQLGASIDIFGTEVVDTFGLITWSIVDDLVSGESESASTTYYCYREENGGRFMTEIEPYERPDFKGMYHPHRPAKCLGWAFNDSSSDLVSVGSFKDLNNWDYSSPTELVIDALTTTPTKGANVRDNVRWARVDDSMELKVEFEQSGAGSAGSSTYVFALPEGFKIDTGKAHTPDAQVGESAVGVGNMSGNADGISATSRIITVFIFDATQLILTQVDVGTNARALISSAVFPLSNANLIYTYTARIPIKGWS